MTDQKWYLPSGEELKTGTIQSINENNGTAKATGVQYTCYRCNGSGSYPSICYDGICLKCNGRGRMTYVGAKTVYSAQALAERMAKQAEKQASKNAERMAEQAKEAAKIDEAFAEILKEHEWLNEAILVAQETKNSFMIDVIDNIRRNGRISEKQLAVLQKNVSFAKDKQRQDQLALDAGFIGKEGQRVEMRAKIAVKRFLEGRGFQGRGTYLYKLISSEGSIISTFTDRDLGSQYDELRFKATVKKHEMFQGSKQTLVTRVSIEGNP